MPDAAEMRMDPRALAEGRQKADALPDGHLVELVEALKKESEGATRDLRSRWSGYWDMWQNEVAFPDKEEWQSQVWIPKPFAAVEQGAAIIQRSLLDSPDFFGVSGTDDEDKIIAAHVWKPLLKLLLDRAGFVPKFADGCKVGFMLGIAGYWKYRWAVSQTPVLQGASVDPQTGAILPSFRYQPRSMLTIDYVLPWHIFRDPDTKARENFSGTYLIHSEWVGRPELKAMVGRGWDQAAVGKVLEMNNQQAQNSRMPSSQQEEASRKQQSWERHKFRRAYLGDEAWLDVLDQNGDVVFPNALMVHSHGQILMRPRDNPLWATDPNTGRRKWPFVAGAPIVHPARFEGRGILEQDEDLSLMFSNALNLFADGMNWKVNPGTEVYQPGLVNWDDTGDFPGKPWLKNVKEPVLTPARRGEINVAEVMAFLNYLDQLRQNVNFITDFVVGLPGTRADITKGEVQIKTGQSLGMFDGIGRALEQIGRTGVELAYDFALQYLGGNDYTDPSLASIIGPHRAYLIAKMPLADRLRALQGNYDFTFTGVSQALQKADMLAKVMQFATLAQSPGYAGTTKPSQVLRIVSELLGVNDRIDIFDPAPPAPPMLPPGIVAPNGGGNPNATSLMRAVGPNGGGVPVLG